MTPVVVVVAADDMTEEERREGYARRGHVWPLNATVPNTNGWRQNHFYRIAQVQRIQDRESKYNGWLQVMSAAVAAPNFTQHGWGLTRAPEFLVRQLRTSLHDGLPTATEEADGAAVIDDGDLLPLFIEQDDLSAQHVLDVLRPAHEKWSGVPLTGALAYGLRAYRNNSVLAMHVDRADTHIISCILHVDSSDDAEPWPLFIEDFSGNTHEVILTSGDMLFYESSKCIHGRPRPFRGSWYSSIFVHYYPTTWDPEEGELEVQYSLPPHWDEMPPPDDNPYVEELVMSGSAMREPNCPDQWCGTVDTIKWQGPAKEGVVITTGHVVGEEQAELQSCVNA
jgi:hypothetical protein